MLKAVVNSPVRSGDQTINNGNLIVGTAGKGIDFSANSGAAGMTSELLTWYEEGTCALAISDGTTSSSTTTCRYTRIGRQVVVTVEFYNVNVSALSTSEGLKITGMPFSAGTTTTCGLYCPNGTYNNLVGEIAGTTVQIFKIGNNIDSTFLKLTDLSSPTNVTFRGPYIYFA